MHVGIGRLGRRHLVFGNGADKVHVEDVLVERYGFSGVLAAIGDVVDLLNNTHRFLLRANLLAQISNRCY